VCSAAYKSILPVLVGVPSCWSCISSLYGHGYERVHALDLNTTLCGLQGETDRPQLRRQSMQNLTNQLRQVHCFEYNCTCTADCFCIFVEHCSCNPCKHVFLGTLRRPDICKAGLRRPGCTNLDTARTAPSLLGLLETKWIRWSPRILTVPIVSRDWTAIRSRGIVNANTAVQNRSHADGSAFDLIAIFSAWT
jgi:hypothetical protein